MNHKLPLSVVALSLAFVPACAASTSTDAESEEEHLGQAQQAFCFGTPGNTPPAANVVVPGRDNQVTSGTYSYGSGGCDGYIAKFVALGTNGGAPVVVGHVGKPLTESVCNNTKVTIWTWVRVDGGSWSYKGSRTFNAFWYEYSHVCLEKPFVWLEGPYGDYEVVAKVQARSEYLGPNGVGYAYNQPVTIQVQ